MSNLQDTYLNAAKRGSKKLPSNIQPGKVISVDKMEYYNDEIEFDEIDDYKNDPDYVPESEDTDTESEGSEVEGSEVEGSEVEESEVEGSEVEGSEGEGSEVEESKVEGSEGEEFEVESEGSEVEDDKNDTDCEWKQGWKQGWKAAIKFMKEQAKLKIKVLKCDNCGTACNLKKCGGTCNGCVKYCNEECQLIHWKKTHKFACSKYM
jgi:hypothetical protein